jgi:hypothetical protein
MKLQVGYVGYVSQAEDVTGTRARGAVHAVDVNAVEHWHVRGV